MRSIRLLLAPLAFLVSGCMASIQDTLSVTYVAPEGVSINRLAILPVTAGEGLEGFRRTVADSLYRALESMHSGVDLISSEESLRLLNDAGLAERYANMIVAYDRTGILDRSVMEAMGQALQAQHLLHTRVGYDEESRVGVGVVTSVAEHRTQRIELFAHIWDVSRGDIVWEASGGAASTSGEFLTARTVPEILASATRNLAARIPITRE